MRRFPLVVLFLFSASLIGFAQGRSGGAASGSSSSGSAASSHSSGSSGGSFSSTSSSSPHSGGGSSASSHSSAASSHSVGGGSKAGSSAGSASRGAHNGHASSSPTASHADRNDSSTSRSSRLSSDNVKSKPQQPVPTKVNPQQPTTKPHNWLTRLFHRQRPELAKAPKPCVGKNCPLPPPKPCKGQNCPPPPPSCGAGTISNGRGGCVPTSQAGNNVCATNPLASGCPAALAQNQSSNCAALRTQLEQAIMELNRLQQARNAACAANPQSNECISLTQRYNAEELEVESLRQRLIACRS